METLAKSLRKLKDVIFDVITSINSCAYAYGNNDIDIWHMTLHIRTLYAFHY